MNGVTSPFLNEARFRSARFFDSNVPKAFGRHVCSFATRASRLWYRPLFNEQMLDDIRTRGQYRKRRILGQLASKDLSLAMRLSFRLLERQGLPSSPTLAPTRQFAMPPLPPPVRWNDGDESRSFARLKYRVVSNNNEGVE